MIEKLSPYKVHIVAFLSGAAFILLVMGQTSILMKLISLLVLAAYIFCAIPTMSHFVKWVALSRKWTSVSGKVVKASYREMDILITGGAKHRIYTPMIEYTYSVDGNLFRGRQVNANEKRVYSHEEVKKLLVRYPVGANVPVFRLLKDARVAVLQLDHSLDRYDAIIAAALIVMIPLLGDVLTK